MKRYLLLGLFAFMVKPSWAVTYLAVPELVYSQGVTNYHVSNIDVKGAIIKSGNFRLINTPKNFDVDAVVAKITTTKDNVSPINESKEFTLGKPIGHAKSFDPQYILVGKVIATDMHDNHFHFAGTNSTSTTRTLDMSVDYYLIDLSDNAVVASFNINASGSQVAILNSTTNDKYYASQGKLIKDTSEDLASQVVDGLSTINTTQNNSDSTLINKFTTYDE